METRSRAPVLGGGREVMSCGARISDLGTSNSARKRD